MNWEAIAYGPSRGYMSSVDRSSVPADMLASGSLDMRYSPLEGKYLTRNGSEIREDTFGAIVGLCESKFGGRARCIVEFSSPSLSDTYPSYLVVYSDETDKEGYAYFRGNTTGANNGLGRMYSATHYPTTSLDLSTYEHKWTPHWSENATTPQGRGTTIAQRTTLAAGARRCIGSGNWLFINGLQSNPKMWNRGFNDATGSGTNADRLRPWGHYRPLWLPRMLTTNLPAEEATVRSWKNDDRFFMTMTFVFEDGSESAPFVPSVVVSASIFGGPPRYGLEYVNSGGLVDVPGTINNYRAYLRFTGLAIGPQGTVGRKLYRTAKVNAADPIYGAFRLWEHIKDNTTTQFDSYSGDDESLLALDPLDEEGATARLFAQAWPLRARYSWAFDGRVAIGYLKTRPEAIVICPTGYPDTGAGGSGAQSRGTNGDDNITSPGHFFVRVYDNAGVKTLQLRCILSGTGLPATPLTTAITLTAAKTLQDVCNEINSTLTTTINGGGEWVAAVAPGTSDTISSDNIDYTTASNPSGVAYAFGDDSASLLDDATVGNQRCWNNAWPGLLMLTQAYLALQPTRSDEFCHTEAGPSLKNTGSYGSAFTFVLNGPGWRIRSPEDAGVLMGGAPLADGCVVFYSKSIWRYQNLKDGTTGEDKDYRLNKISDKGCIAWDSIAWGNNWVGWMSRGGYCVSDGNPDNEHIITGAIHDPESGAGDLNYEINQCIAASAADNDAAYLSAAVLGSSLYLNYRASGSATYPNRTIEYNFLAGAANSGLAQVLGPNGQPYGWSPPWTLGYATMGRVRKSTGLWKLGAKDEADGGHSTGTGRIDRFDTGTNDPGSAPIVAVGFQKMQDFGGRRARNRKWRFKHKTPSGSATTVSLSRDVARATSTNYTLAATTSGDPFSYDTERTKLAQQTPSRVYELKFTNDGLGGSAFEWFASEGEFRRLNTPVT